MHRIILLSLSFLLAVNGFCKEVHISGRILNASSSKVNVRVQVPVVLDATSYDKQLIYDSFSIDIPIDKTGECFISLSGNPIFLYVHPGDKVHIEADNKDFYKTLKIKGDHADDSRYLTDKHYIDITAMTGTANVKKDDPNAMKKFMEEQEKIKLDFEVAAPSKYHLSEAMKKYRYIDSVYYPLVVMLGNWDMNRAGFKKRFDMDLNEQKIEKMLVGAKIEDISSIIHPTYIIFLKAYQDYRYYHYIDKKYTAEQQKNIPNLMLDSAYAFSSELYHDKILYVRRTHFIADTYHAQVAKPEEINRLYSRYILDYPSGEYNAVLVKTLKME